MCERVRREVMRPKVNRLQPYSQLPLTVRTQPRTASLIICFAPNSGMWYHPQRNRCEEGWSWWSEGRRFQSLWIMFGRLPKVSWGVSDSSICPILLELPSASCQELCLITEDLGWETPKWDKMSIGLLKMITRCWFGFLGPFILRKGTAVSLSNDQENSHFSTPNAKIRSVWWIWQWNNL